MRIGTDGKDGDKGFLELDWTIWPTCRKEPARIRTPFAFRLISLRALATSPVLVSDWLGRRCPLLHSPHQPLRPDRAHGPHPSHHTITLPNTLLTKIGPVYHRRLERCSNMRSEIR